MANHTNRTDFDPMGEAMEDYYFDRSPGSLLIHTEYGTKEKMPVGMYFRHPQQFPELEKEAIRNCRGKILEVGAGAGSHALALQTSQKKVTALDISGKAVAIMKQRGVRNVVATDIFDYSGSGFDTILMLMNGIGLCGTVDRFEIFLDHCRSLLKPTGQLLFDSSDVIYMTPKQLPKERYYGEFRYRYEYKKRKTDWFQWLYIDPTLMSLLAIAKGWSVEILYEDENNQYLARLLPKGKKS